MYERTYHTKVLKNDTDTSKHRPFPWKKLVWVLSIALVVAGIIIFIRAPRFQIQTVNVTGTNVADPVEVSDFVLNEIQGNYLWILPKSSVILVTPEQITLRIKDHFARFKEVTTDRDGVNSLRVSVTEYPGVYLWCDTSDACAFMDETGTVFADAPYFSGSAYLKIYSGERAAYPFQPITPAQLAMVSQITERLQAMEIAPLSFAFESDRELTVTFFHNGTHTRIFFDPDDDVVTALDTLYTGLRTQPMARLYHDRTQILQYLDLRFANKLVYKFQ